MMKRRNVNRLAFLALVLAVLAITPAVAEDIRPPYETFPEALGGFYGPFSGTGLHYQRWLGQNGFHVSGGVIYVPFEANDWWGPDTTLDYAVGGEFQRRVYGEAFTPWLAGSLYLFASGQHRGYIPVVLIAEGYDADPSDEGYDWVDAVYDTGTFQAQLTAAVGIGIELILFEHFSVPLEFGYGATWTITETDWANAFEVGPQVQTGLRYRY